MQVWEIPGPRCSGTWTENLNARGFEWSTISFWVIFYAISSYRYQRAFCFNEVWWSETFWDSRGSLKTNLSLPKVFPYMRYSFCLFFTLPSLFNIKDIHVTWSAFLHEDIPEHNGEQTKAELILCGRGNSLTWWHVFWDSFSGCLACFYVKLTLLDIDFTKTLPVGRLSIMWLPFKSISKWSEICFGWQFFASAWN